jgi:hypothetical protein
MQKDTLVETNPYLRDSQRRQRLLIRTVVSSTAVEGVHFLSGELQRLSESREITTFRIPSKSAGSHR